MRKPDFFIVGAARCGTTAMNNYLREHPDIYMAASSHEPHFFGSDLYRPNYIRDEQVYLSLFEEAKDEKRVGEKSVGYIHSTRAAKEIKEFTPSAKIIILLRNPVDVIHSIHSLLVYIGHEDIADFEAALDAEEDRRRGMRLPEGVSPQEAWRFLYRDKGAFTEQVRRYLDAFTRENVHVIIFDDFIHDTTGSYRQTLEFLDVTTAFQPEFQRFNVNRHVRTRALHRILKRPPQFIRSFVKMVTPFQLRQRVVQGLLGINTTYGTRPPLPERLRRQLQAEYLPEVERLSELLGRDLMHWCQA